MNQDGYDYKDAQDKGGGERMNREFHESHYNGNALMKKKYIIEAIVVVIILGMLLWITVPKFFASQTTLQAKKMQETVDRVYLMFQKDVLNFKEGSYRDTVLPSWSGPITRADGTVVPLFTFQEDWTLDFKGLTNEYSRYKYEWPYSRFSVYATAFYAKKDNRTSKLEDNYADRPFYYCVYFCVGDQKRPSFFRGGQFIVDVDSEGFMQVIPPVFIPYSPSNGLDSYGEFYHDSTNDWPKQKAVLVGEGVLAD